MSSLTQRGILTQQVRDHADQPRDLRGSAFELGWPREQQHVLHHLVERVDARDDVFQHRSARIVLRHATAEHLHRSANAGQRILHLVGNDRSHLAELGQRRLLAQLALHLHPGAEIVKDSGELPFAFDRDLADRQMQREGRAVLAASLHFPSDADDLGAAGRQIPRQIGVVLLLVRRRHEHVDVVTEHFCRRVAEQPLRRRIERLDAAVRVDDDDTVDSGVDDRPPPSFTGAQLPFESNALRQVVQHAGELAFTADPHFPDREMHRKQGAVTPATGHLASDADDLGLAGCEIALEVPVMLFVLRRWHQQADIAPDDLRFGIAKQLLSAAVERLDDSPWR